MKLCVDPGHGGIDPGAMFKRVKESDIVLKISDKLVLNFAASKAWEVRRTRCQDVEMELSERVDFANRWGADLFVSIHCNADPDEDLEGMPEADGAEVWHYPSPKSSHLAKMIGRAMKDEFPNEPYRGEKESTKFYVLRKTTMPAVLVEVAFIDNSESVLELQNPWLQHRIALAIYNGIILSHLAPA